MNITTRLYLIIGILMTTATMVKACSGALYTEYHTPSPCCQRVTARLHGLLNILKQPFMTTSKPTSLTKPVAATTTRTASDTAEVSHSYKNGGSGFYYRVNQSSPLCSLQ